MTAVLNHALFSFEFINPMTLRSTRILSSCNSQYMWYIQFYTAIHLDVLSRCILLTCICSNILC